MSYPTAQNPGGPTQDYTFEAVSAGTAEIVIAHEASDLVFTVTVDVAP